MTLHYLRLVLAALSLAGIAYYIVSIFCAHRFLAWRRNRQRPELEKPVSILKPVRGAEPTTLEAFRSHCLLDYPEYEIIFGVNDAADAAIPLIKQLITEFPQRKIKLVVSSETLGANRKVSNLIQMLPHASHDLLVINDGDIRVPPDYLRRLVSFFADPTTGLATCLYRGAASQTLGSKLEALGISTDFAAGVLVARQLEGGISFGLGSTLACTRAALEKSGGIVPLADYLADDYALGHRIHQAGYKVQLADFTVETLIQPYSFGEFLRHQMRWARTIRDARPAGYAGLLFTFGLPWAIFTVIASLGTAWSWALLTAALIARLWMAWLTGVSVLNASARDFWLLPLRDLIAFFVWLASFFGNKVSWGGTEYILHHGKLRKLD